MYYIVDKFSGALIGTTNNLYKAREIADELCQIFFVEHDGEVIEVK